MAPDSSLYSAGTAALPAERGLPATLTSIAIPLLIRLDVLFLSKLPCSEITDNLLALVRFIRTHRRLPRNRLMLNDVLYRIKTKDLSNPLRVFVTDKEYAKMFIAAVVGGKYNVPTLAVLKDEDELRRYAFPRECCIKSTHASGRIILRRNGDPVDRARISGWQRESYYRELRERNYKYLKPKIIVEQLLSDRIGKHDVKVFCWNSSPRLIQAGLFHEGIDHRTYYDTDWNQIVPRGGSPSGLAKPARLLEALALSRKLAAYFDFVRVDFYLSDDFLYVGEITNCHWGAFDKFRDWEFEGRLSRVLFGEPVTGDNRHRKRSGIF